MLVVLLLGGCVSPSASFPPDREPATALDPVVVALIDSGATPYYQEFWSDDESAVAKAVAYPYDEVFIPLPNGNTDPITRDDATWDSLEPGTLYHFKGTRLLGISFDEEREFHYVRDAHFHGAGTSWLVARDAPSTIIVMAQVKLGTCASSGDLSCTFSPSIADAMEWIADQEWIDVVSISLAYPANAPDRPELHNEVGRFLRASEAAAQRGAIIVNGAGNEPIPSLQDHFNGPPWIITVGGVESESRGEQVLASKGVDVVANFTEWAPRFGEGEMEWRSGTSFSTPVVAGTLAQALSMVRAAESTGPPTIGQLRDALNSTAVTFAATEWKPKPPNASELPPDVVPSLSLPVLVQPQLGWGYVHAGLAPEIARRVIEQDFSVPAGKEEAAFFQPAWQTAREEYWERIALGASGHGAYSLSST